MWVTEEMCGKANPDCPDSLCTLPKNHETEPDYQSDIWHANDSDGWFSPRCGRLHPDGSGVCVYPADHMEEPNYPYPYPYGWHAAEDGATWLDVSH